MNAASLTVFMIQGPGLLVLRRMPDLCHSDRRAVWLQAQPASLPKILPAPAVLRPCISALRLSAGLCCQKLPVTNINHHCPAALAGLHSPPKSCSTAQDDPGWKIESKTLSKQKIPLPLGYWAVPQIYLSISAIHSTTISIASRSQITDSTSLFFPLKTSVGVLLIERSDTPRTVLMESILGGKQA